MKIKARIERKINETLPALLPNRGPATSTGDNTNKEPNNREKRAIPVLAIAQGAAAIGGMLIKGIDAIVDAKQASSFINAIKMLNANVCLLYTSPSPRDATLSRMPSSA